MRKMFTDELPKRKGKNDQINWKKSIGYKVKFIYDEIEGEVKIVDYDAKKHNLYIKYLNKEPFKIATSSFQDCRLIGLLKEEVYTYEYDETNPRRVDSRGLPLNSHGIDWEQVAINKTKVPFVYDNIEDTVEIIDYDIKDQKLYIKYLDQNIFEVTTGNFTKCKLGNLLGKYTSEFKIEIGNTFKDDKRDITIIDRQYKNRKRKDGHIENQKWYLYHCNKCGYEDWIEESNLLKHKIGCSVCCYSPRNSVLGINTIWDTDRWMCDLGVFEEDAKKYTKSQRCKIEVTCPDCGTKKKMRISDIYSNHSIGCVCSDGFSYPEKTIYNILEQLQLDFIIQLNKTTFKWCEDYRYDFYFKINDEDYIVETHGMQHYENSFSSIKSSKKIKTVKEEQENDRLKKELALQNGIKEENYIVIDCRKSELDWIRGNDKGVVNSKLGELFDLSNIDWNLVEDFALSNLVKKVCKIKRDNSNLTTTEIGKIMNLSCQTIIRYLKKGSRIWEWVHYDPKEEMKKCAINNNKMKCKPVEIFKDEKILGKFESYSELERQSEERFGVKLFAANISLVCRGKQKSHRGFTFK